MIVLDPLECCQPAYFDLTIYLTNTSILVDHFCFYSESKTMKKVITLDADILGY